MNKTQNIALGIILIIAGFFRLYQLGQIPVGLHRDEAFLGYNAYSILKTGRDMTGELMPLHLKSFIYSPAGYAYASIPAIALFGLNMFSVRLASAVLGTTTVFLAYVLSMLLFHSHTNRRSYALGSALMLAISPWHINLSRVATENTIVVFLITLGVILYLLSLQKRAYGLLLLVASGVCFFLTLFVYQGPRAFLPFFIPVLFFIFKTSEKKLVRTSLLIYLALIIAPIIIFLATPSLSLRIRTVSLFATEETHLVVNEAINEDTKSGLPLIVARAFHNKAFEYTNQFLKNYFAHFTYTFLFTDSGLPDRYRVPGYGLLHLIELPILILGIAQLIRRHRKQAIFLLLWIALSPVGAALTFDDLPNLQRMEIVFPAISIVLAVGLVHLITFVKLKYRPYAVVAITFIYLVSMTHYLHQYFVQQKYHRPWYRHEGYQELVGEVKARISDYDKAFITNRESAPAIFFLFFESYDPARYQLETKNPPHTDYDRLGFGNYDFSLEECPILEETVTDASTGKKYKRPTNKSGVLYVDYGTCSLPEEPETITIEKVIRRSDDTRVFQIVSVNESGKNQENELGK